MKINAKRVEIMCHMSSFVYRQVHPGLDVDHRVTAEPSRIVYCCCVHMGSTMF